MPGKTADVRFAEPGMRRGINTGETFEVAILARTGLVLATLKECTLSLAQGFDHQHLRHHRGRWVRWPY
jgi:hypothetical protein